MFSAAQASGEQHPEGGEVELGAGAEGFQEPRHALRIWSGVSRGFCISHPHCLPGKGYLHRVARFFLIQHTKTGKIYEINTKYFKCP
jgi:hypothetical protein